MTGRWRQAADLAVLERAGQLQVVPVQAGPSRQGQRLKAVQSQGGADVMRARAGHLVHRADAVPAAAARLDVHVVLPLPAG